MLLNDDYFYTVYLACIYGAVLHLFVEIPTNRILVPIENFGPLSAIICNLRILQIKCAQLRKQVFWIDPFFLTQLAQCLLFSSIEFVNTQIYYQKDKNDTKSLIRNSLMGLSRMHLNPYSYVCLFLCLLQKSSTLLRSEVKQLKY
ncbi:hypothetical protein HUJ04_007194 [Dendroctonus ponderosae]|nr:hypothetical protein HUJ04_007194 [Dendroctonus ponderosae]